MQNEFYNDFPLLNTQINGMRIVYLDNAATTQKPLCVINAITEYYEKHNANPHRGAYALSYDSTAIYEESRNKVAEFVCAGASDEIVFTKSATEALNLVAYSYGMNYVSYGDEILVCIAEHHSNFIPWQNVAKTKGARLRFLYTDEDGKIPFSQIDEKINRNTKIVAIAYASNVLGTINPIKHIVQKAHEAGAVAVLDASQSIPHFKLDAEDLDVDFAVFSGHKILAPMGIGVLYSKRALLECMPPMIYGGGMVEYASENKASFENPPLKFEGGTPNVEGAYALSKAIDYINDIGYDQIAQIEAELIKYMLDKLKELDFVTIYGTKKASERIGVVAFNLDQVHPHDVATVLDSYGVAVRAGHHCAYPLMKHIGINACCRVSLYFYNTTEDIDIFVDALKTVRGWLGLEPR